jgi:hypothetical protein
MGRLVGTITLLVSGSGLVAASLCLWLCGCSSTALPSPDDPVQSVNSQSDALRFAKASDIPAAGKADRMVIKIMAGPPRHGAKAPYPEGRSFTIADDAAIKSLVQTLVVKETVESGRMNYATVTFYKGTEEIRSIWLFENGEWGFVRPAPGASHSTGVSGDLVRNVKQLVQANKADD